MKGIFKYIIFLILIVVVIFVNVSGINAAPSDSSSSDNYSEESGSQTCECYYSAIMRTDDSGDPYDTYYLASIKFDKDTFNSTSDKSKYQPQISFFGERGFNTVSGSSGKIQDETISAEWFTRFFGDGAGVSKDQVNSLFDAGCNCSVLGTLSFVSSGGTKEMFYNLEDYYWMLPQNDLPVLGYKRVDFSLMTKEQFEEQKNSNDIAQTSKDQGFAVSIENILKWADEYGYDVDSVGEPCTIIAPAMKDLLSAAFWIISILGIILVVVMTAISFIKAIVGSDDEKFRNAFSHLIVRIVTVIILLLLPMVLGFIINIINDNFTGTVQIGDDNSVFCDIA